MDKDIHHIASDYFSGRISTSDREYLNTWLNQSPDNKAVFAELERVWKLTGSLQTDVEIDVDKEWDRFLKHRNDEGVKTIPLEANERSLFTPLLKIAAIAIPAVLIIGSLLVFFTIRSGNNQDLVALQTGENRQEHVLPDGSKVWMNRNSTLSYPKEFKGAQRKVKLTGEAFFSVVKGKGTFTIDAGASEVKVLGTQFNVRSYAGEAKTEVMVKEGKVSLTAMANKHNGVMLIAGEKGLLNIATDEIQKDNSSSINAFGWVTQSLAFSNSPLHQVADDIARYFNKEVVVKSGANATFTGTFAKPQLNEVLHTLNLTLNYSCQLRNDTVFIEK